MVTKRYMKRFQRMKKKLHKIKILKIKIKIKIKINKLIKTKKRRV